MIGIVIPFFKIEFFRECLNSLAKQTNKNFLVYIGDDASPEDPSELINEYSEQLNIKYKRFDKNLGSISLTQQWERCIDLTGEEEWLMILGDDDYLNTDVIENWYKEVNTFEDRTNIVRFATISVDSLANPISKKYMHPTWESAPDSFYRRFLQHTRSSLSEYVFRKTSYLKYGFCDYPLGWYSDNRAWLDFSENRPIYTINEAVVYIRTSQLNISGRTDNLELKSEALLQFFDYLIKKKISLFKKEERLKLLRYYEDRLKENRRWINSKKIVFTYFYLLNYDSFIFMKFIKRQLKSFLRSE